MTRRRINFAILFLDLRDMLMIYIHTETQPDMPQYILNRSSPWSIFWAILQPASAPYKKNPPPPLPPRHTHPLRPTHPLLCVLPHESFSEIFRPNLALFPGIISQLWSLITLCAAAFHPLLRQVCEMSDVSCVKRVAVLEAGTLAWEQMLSAYETRGDVVCQQRYSRVWQACSYHGVD